MISDGKHNNLNENEHIRQPNDQKQFMVKPTFLTSQHHKESILCIATYDQMIWKLSTELPKHPRTVLQVQLILVHTKTVGTQNEANQKVNRKSTPTKFSNPYVKRFVLKSSTTYLEAMDAKNEQFGRNR